MTPEPQASTRGLILGEEELREITRYQKPAAQARFLESMRVAYTRRKDGSLVVGRASMERALLQLGTGTAVPATEEEPDEAGIVWKVK